MDKDRRHYHENAPVRSSGPTGQAKESKHEKEKGCDWLVENCLIFPPWGISILCSRIEIWGKAIRQTINSFIVCSEGLSPKS